MSTMDPEAPASLRERKKVETRHALRAAAVRLYLEHGPADVTVHGICAAAGVSPRTFFNYFDTKDDAVFDWDHRLTHQLVTGLHDRPASEQPLTALHRTMQQTVPVMVADPGWHERGQLLRTHPELIPKLLHSGRRMEEAMARAIAERAGRAEEDRYARLLASSALAALRTAIQDWDPDSGAEGLLALTDEMFAVLASGLAEPGRTRSADRKPPARKRKPDTPEGTPG